MEQMSHVAHIGRPQMWPSRLVLDPHGHLVWPTRSKCVFHDETPLRHTTRTAALCTGVELWAREAQHKPRRLTSRYNVHAMHVERPPPREKHSQICESCCTPLPRGSPDTGGVLCGLMNVGDGYEHTPLRLKYELIVRAASHLCVSPLYYQLTPSPVFTNRRHPSPLVGTKRNDHPPLPVQRLCLQAPGRIPHLATVWTGAAAAHASTSGTAAYRGGQHDHADLGGPQRVPGDAVRRRRPTSRSHSRDLGK